MDCWKHFDYLFQSQDFSKAYPTMILNEEASDPTFYEDINTKILLIKNAPGIMSKTFHTEVLIQFFFLFGNGDSLKIFCSLQKES